MSNIKSSKSVSHKRQKVSEEDIMESKINIINPNEINNHINSLKNYEYYYERMDEVLQDIQETRKNLIQGTFINYQRRNPIPS